MKTCPQGQSDWESLCKDLFDASYRDAKTIAAVKELLAERDLLIIDYQKEYKKVADQEAAMAYMRDRIDALVAALRRADTILRGMDPYGLYASRAGKDFAALLSEVDHAS